MPTKIGTLTFGTYTFGPGLPNQNHLIYAANAKVWWFFYITSASDTTGSAPGTHVIKCFYSSSGNLFNSTWTAGTNSPNFNSSSASLAARFGSGRNFGCCYWNNQAGTRKDIILIHAAMQNTDKLSGGSSYNGVLRASVTANTITWDTWGSWTAQAWNNLANHVFDSGAIIVRSNDGYLNAASCFMHSEVDCNVASSVDPDNGDTWQAGQQSATGNVNTANALVTNMSNQTNLKVGMALSNDAGDWVTNRYPGVVSIDSGTQVTMQTTPTATATGTEIRWWQFGAGNNRNNTMVDDTMTNECLAYGMAPLDGGQMLLVYDSGAGTPPNFTQLKSLKSNQTRAQGFWPSTTDGTGSVNVFSGASTQEIQDWCLIALDTTHIYCARRTGTTSINIRKYDPVGNSWSDLATQPPTFGGTIKAGGGVVGVTNNFDFWLFVIDSTNNVISYVKYNEQYDTWGTWATVASVGSTALCMACSPMLGPSSGVTSQIGLIYQETNGGSFDAWVAPLLIGDPPDWDGIINRPDPRHLRAGGLPAGVR